MSGFDMACQEHRNCDYFAQHPYTGDVYDFLRNRLLWNADRCSRTKYGLSGFECMLDPPGPLEASVANLQPGDMVETLDSAIFSSGQSIVETQAPYKDWEPESRWWPVIFQMVPARSRHIASVDISVVPFYCPCLAVNSARAWYVHMKHISQVWFVSRL